VVPSVRFSEVTKEIAMKSKALPLLLIFVVCGMIAMADGEGTKSAQKAGVAAGEPPPIGPCEPAPSPPSGVYSSPPGQETADPLARWTGRWNVEFAGGPHEVHELRKDRSVTIENVAENYSTKGYIGFDGKRVTILRDGGGLERWTPVGDRMVVEWYSSSELRTRPAHLAIGERAE
jgi:hypothetical protein